MPTLTEYSQSTAQELGRWMSFTTTAAGSTTTIVSSSLADSETHATRYSNGYVFVQSGTYAGQQGKVKNSGGFAPSTGTFTVAVAMTGAPGSAETCEWLGHLPRYRYMDVPGIKDCVNEALQRVWIKDRLSIAGVTDQKQYSLSSYPWLRETKYIRQLCDPKQVYTDNPKRSSKRWDLLVDGERTYLLIEDPYRSDEMFYLDVFRPASSYLKISGSWANQTTDTAGLVAEADEALPSIQRLRPVILWRCYLALADFGPSDYTEYWERKATKQAQIIALRRYLDFDYEDSATGIAPFFTERRIPGAA